MIKLKNILNEASTDYGKYPIPAKEFKQYMKEYAQEIKQAGKSAFGSDWEMAQKVAKYLKSAKTPTTVDEYIKWHNGAKAITGGVPFGMGSGFKDASDGAIVTIVSDQDNITNKEVNLWDGKILPYIEKKAK